MIYLSQWYVLQAEVLRLGIWFAMFCLPSAKAARDILDSGCSQPIQDWNIVWARSKSSFKTTEIWGLFDTMA